MTAKRKLPRPAGRARPTVGCEHAVLRYDAVDRVLKAVPCGAPASVRDVDEGWLLCPAHASDRAQVVGSEGLVSL